MVKYEIVSQEKPKIISCKNYNWKTIQFLEDYAIKKLDFVVEGILVSIIPIGKEKVLIDNLSKYEAIRIFKKLNETSKNYCHEYRIKITPNMVVKLRKDYKNFKKGEVFKIKDWNNLFHAVDVWDQVDKVIYETIIPKNFLEIIDN